MRSATIVTLCVGLATAAVTKTARDAPAPQTSQHPGVSEKYWCEKAGKPPGCSADRVEYCYWDQVRLRMLQAENEGKEDLFGHEKLDVWNHPNGMINCLTGNEVVPAGERGKGEESEG
ncbi:hypothetical protein CDD83_7623 [Cordyceps sp. RAO-2017]|nr:hypothetical protein CDD83_7623 [Cordyceps sp. RAO-2017]